MKKTRFNSIALTALVGVLALTFSCSRDDAKLDGPETQPSQDRWITVAGAIMGATDGRPGDGNGGTLIYSISKEDAHNPDKSFDVFENGYLVQSARTARLQSSEDGNTFFNIAYGGNNGGEFSKYTVKGGQNLTAIDGTVNISQYAGTAPRWAKLFDGDKSGIAVNVTLPTVNSDDSGAYKYTRGTGTVLSLDLENSLISETKSYEIPLTPEEEAAGHHIFRLDAPVLNSAKDKLIIGTWMRQTNTETGANISDFEHLGSKSVVVDYPSLDNPKIISSTVGYGDTSGYRSFNAFLANDGSIYQATQRDIGGSHILKIGSNNEYDNGYKFSLDDALGVTGSYIENWKYAGNGIAIVSYKHDGSQVSSISNQPQSFLARIDLIAKTAQKLDLPYSTDLYRFQYQGYVVDGDDIYVTFAPVGQNGNIYIINKNTGTVKKGAQLINKPGNHFIGAF